MALCPDCSRVLIYNPICKIYYCIVEHKKFNRSKKGKFNLYGGGF